MVHGLQSPEYFNIFSNEWQFCFAPVANIRRSDEWNLTPLFPDGSRQTHISP